MERKTMEFINNLSHFVQGYFWATILFPVEYYLLKPVAVQVYGDVVKYLSSIKSKILPNG